mgnify:FL=1
MMTIFQLFVHARFLICCRTTLKVDWWECPRIKQREWRLTVGCSRCRKTLNLGISCRRLADYVKEFYWDACMPHVQQDYFSSFVQSDHCFLASSVPLPSSLLKLPNHKLCITYSYSQYRKMPINWNGTDIDVLNSLWVLVRDRERAKGTRTREIHRTRDALARVYCLHLVSTRNSRILAV